MFAATILLAISAISLPGPVQDASAQPTQPAPAWPHNEGGLFSTSSREAWTLVLGRLKELGLSAAKTDSENQLLLTKWASFGNGRLQWLPKPKLPPRYIAQRVQFEVFVSPFVEPARVYVGSVTELRLMPGTTSGSLQYNNRGLNHPLLSELAKALGQDGLAIPADREDRDRLSASLLTTPPSDCHERARSCTDARLSQSPRTLPLSEFDVRYPLAAVADRVQGPIVIELEVSEDGAVLSGRLTSAPRSHQLDGAAAGATSLLVFSPPRLCGCPSPHTSTYTINYTLEQR
jgi:TonB family protein